MFFWGAEGTTGNHERPAGHSLKTCDQGPGQGPATRNQGPGMGEQGPGTQDQGTGARDQGAGTKDQGPGSIDN